MAKGEPNLLLTEAHTGNKTCVNWHRVIRITAGKHGTDIMLNDGQWLAVKEKLADIVKTVPDYIDLTK